MNQTGNLGYPAKRIDRNKGIVDSLALTCRPLCNLSVNPSTKQEAIELATGIMESVSDSSPGDVGLFVPFPFLECVREIAADKFVVGAEMITPEMNGAFTGGIAPIMLKSMGIEWALAGHSERRTINKETDEYINAQCKLLVENDMNVVLCIGETLEEFEKSLVASVCEIQLKKGLAGISAEDMDKVTIAVSSFSVHWTHPSMPSR